MTAPAHPPSPAPITTWPFRPGVEVGSYRIEDVLGRGGLGVVYRARDLTSGRTLALKILRVGMSSSSKHLYRFLREARVTARLRHPGIVPVVDAGLLRGYPFLALELIEGPSLELVLITSRKLTPERTLELLLPVTTALAYAHENGVVHRDVKPANVLLGRSGQPFLTDFGLALDQDDPKQITWPGQALGTPAYVAPEQRRGDRATPLSDVYALGATLFECLTGVLPGAVAPCPLGAAMERLAPETPAMLRELVLRCLETDPLLRPPGALAVADVLRACRRTPVRPLRRTRTPPPGA